MASYDVDAYGAKVRVREAGQVVLFHAITLGLYNLYWYFAINRELRDFGRVYRLERCGACNPALELAAVVLAPIAGIAMILTEEPGLVFLGLCTAFLIPISSWYRTTKRIQEAQGVAGADPLNGVAIVFSYLGGLFLTLPFLIIPYLVQKDLNRLWGSFAALDPETRRAPERARISVGALDSLPDAGRWDLSRLSGTDLESIEEFLATREGQGAATRARYAVELDSRIRPLVPDAPRELDPERFLELVYAASR